MKRRQFPLSQALIRKVERAAAAGRGQHEPGSRKSQVRIMFEDHGEEAAAALAELLGIKRGTYVGWRSDWNIEARGDLPAWRRKQEEARAARAFTPTHTTIGPGGRIVIPAPMRTQLGLNIGSDIIVSIKDGEIRLSALKPSKSKRNSPDTLSKQGIGTRMSSLGGLHSALHATEHRINLVNGVKRLPTEDCAKLQVLVEAARLYPRPVSGSQQVAARDAAEDALNEAEWLIYFTPHRPAKATSVRDWARDVFFMRDNGANDVVDQWVKQVATPIARAAKNRRVERGG